MPLETATYISGLVASNPAGTDSEGQGDDHLRLIKATLLATFPNITGAVTLTQAALNNIALGVGTMHAFPADPGSTVAARGGTAAGTEPYVNCDGSTYASSKFPALAASGLVTVAGPNFSVPLLTDTGRFLRSYQTSVTGIGSPQANQNAAHTHTFASSGNTGGESANHTHNWGGTFGTSGESNGHSHSIPFTNASLATPGGFAAIGSPTYVTTGSGTTTSDVSADHSHSVSVGGTTDGDSVAHIHTYSFSGTTSSTGSSEARPEAFTVMWTLKT